MIKQDYINLMNQEFDGTNSPEESRELEDYLSGHSEARTYYRELAQALGVFENVDMLNPQPGLREIILSQVDQLGGQIPGADHASGHKSLLAAIRDLLRPRLEPAYAFTFIVGLAVGLAVFAGSSWLTGRHGTDLYDNVKGTANHSSWNQKAVIEGELELPGIEGLYRTIREGQDLRLSLKLRSEQPAVIQLSLGPYTTLQHYSSTNPVPANLTVSNSLVELNHRGRGSYDLVFHLDSERDTENLIPITMLVFSEGRLVMTQTLENEDQ